MTTIEIRAAMLKRPFRPFFLRMASGETVEVRHTEFLALSPGGRTISVGLKEGFAIIDLLLVESIQYDSEERRRPRRRSA